VFSLPSTFTTSHTFDLVGCHFDAIWLKGGTMVWSIQTKHTPVLYKMNRSVQCTKGGLFSPCLSSEPPVPFRCVRRQDYKGDYKAHWTFLRLNVIES
jgi:hypothetical protein